MCVWWGSAATKICGCVKVCLGINLKVKRGTLLEQWLAKHLLLLEKSKSENRTQDAVILCANIMLCTHEKKRHRTLALIEKVSYCKFSHCSIKKKWLFLTTIIAGQRSTYEVRFKSHQTVKRRLGDIEIACRIAKKNRLQIGWRLEAPQRRSQTNSSIKIRQRHSALQCECSD